jgi:hypothetical protein
MVPTERQLWRHLLAELAGLLLLDVSIPLLCVTQQVPQPFGKV